MSLEGFVWQWQGYARVRSNDMIHLCHSLLFDLGVIAFLELWLKDGHLLLIDLALSQSFLPIQIINSRLSDLQIS
jgi:hypothetical protein